MFGIRRRAPGTPHAEPELPITPMLDMSFQLMAFFILSFRPAPTENQIPLALPRDPADRAAHAVPLDPPSPDDQELVVQISAAGNGSPGRILAVQATGDVELRDTGELFRFLKARPAKRGAKLKFEFAETLNYEFAIKLIDEAKRAGYDKVAPSLLAGK